MKIGKNLVLLSITIVTLITLVAIATYSYFTAYTNLSNKITTNVKMPLRPTFTVSGGGELTLSIPKNLTLQENAYNGNDNWILNENFLRVSKNLTITLTGEPGTTCTYNVYYKDTSSNGNYIYTQTGSGTDFDFRVYQDSNNIITNFSYSLISQTSAGVVKITAFFGGSSAPFNKAKPTITIPSGSTSVSSTWVLEIDFDNRNWDQSALAGKTFKGELYVDDVVCT